MILSAKSRYYNHVISRKKMEYKYTVGAVRLKSDFFVYILANEESNNMRVLVSSILPLFCNL